MPTVVKIAKKVLKEHKEELKKNQQMKQTSTIGKNATLTDFLGTNLTSP